ncbi:hypothetical protein BJ878DRAFT_199405 [Calycina marina]|uniref:Uncharacterized protein n=1 Tax=Calycina marina TaxID=1763456 RepID=A0A9P8CJL5_9HELO|nr:hypothetical protein BJ878DRAFT_199405 [Calycina marina]
MCYVVLCITYATTISLTLPIPPSLPSRTTLFFFLKLPNSQQILLSPSQCLSEVSSLKSFQDKAGHPCQSFLKQSQR